MAKGPVDRRLLRHARTSRVGIALLAVVGAGQAAATLAVAVALCWIVTAPRPSAVALLAGAFGTRAGLAWVEQVVARRTAARVTDELRRSLLAAIVRRGPAWVATYGAGRLTAVLGTGLDSLRPWFSGYLPALVLGVVLPPLVVVVMAVVDPASAVIALCTLPLIPLLGALIGWATQARAKQRWAADARLAGHFLDVVRGLATLKVFGRAERQTAVIADLTDRHRSATMRVLRVAFLSSTALDLVGTLSVGLIAVQAGLRVAAGSMDLAPALLAILLAPEAYRPLREMAARYHASTDAGAVIADVDEILTSGPDVAGGTVPHPSADPAARSSLAHGSSVTHSSALGHGSSVTHSSALGHGSPRAHGSSLTHGSSLGRGGPSSGRLSLSPIAAGRWGVRAIGLVARYPGGSGEALRLDELEVRGGEIVALRGPSGAGKTTALRVLAGLHPAEAGAVAAGRTFYLPQRPALPHARTVAEVFPPEATAGEIRAALRTVGLDGEVTGSTRLTERGGGISSGQRQRLALAALLHRAGSGGIDAAAHARSGPVVTLLLDEPTAHLDAVAEQMVVERLRQFAGRGCAVLVVAHRPALLAAADRIVEVRAPAETPGDTLHAPEAAGVTLTAARVDARVDRDAAGRGVAARRPGTAVALGAASSLAGVLLTGAAAWLLVRASSLPPVLSLSTAVVLVRGSAVARPLLRYLERLVSHDLAFARLGSRRAQVYAGLIPRVPGRLTHRRGDLLTRLVDDVDAQVDGLLRGRLPALAAAVTVVVAAVAVLLAAPAVLVPLAVGVLVAGVVAPAVAARQADRLEVATGRARARMRDAVVETVDGVEELGSGSGRLGVPEERSRTLARLEARAARAAGLAAAVAHLGWGAAAAGTALVLARSGLSAEWSAVLLLGMIALGETVVALPEAAIARRQAAGAARRVAALTSDQPAATDPVRADPDSFRGPGLVRPTLNAVSTASRQHSRWAERVRPADPDREGRSERAAAVQVRGLVAGWDPDERAVLDGFELTLPAGSRTAITGRSGSGKSTLAAVLGGLLDPRSGTVRLDGTDIREMPDDLFRRRVVLVGEETSHVFASTVRENLRLAAPGASDDDLVEVLARVGLTSWWAGLPDGLDTWLGTGGSTVSGGQRRRLATARALLADPGLLILDEPTEGIDEAGARELMADLLDASSGRTVLVLAHRAEGLDLVDRVLELRDVR
ncbi:thiol reductant ABC exporter subunit CydC [Actinoplanes sp. NEAU-A11]|uniref:Thiol reductant ABC exporter subunit CydC n=1 Tax=Actinoplanes aureus TaxID=2792083 RepID=A0A931FVF3_9ACTN|nr:thiol reductant ABC exporter subunit CydC [Actinoplanes aureus]